MILQALAEYYQRRMADIDPSRRLPALGSEDKEIPFIIELTRDGRLAAIKDTRSVEGKKKAATRYQVPKGVKKTSRVAANLLWDNAEYVLAQPDVKKLADAQKKGRGDAYLGRLIEMHAAFKERITALPAAALDDEAVKAVLAFLEASPAAAVAAHSAGAEIAASNPVLSFRLIDDETDLVCQKASVMAAGVSSPDDNDGGDNPAALAAGRCLVSGEFEPIERLHTAIKGVWGAQTSGGNIVSFNHDAFNSFGKSRGANAPVGRSAAFAYTTALNGLLDKGSRQRMQVGDASTVFWSQRADDAEFEAWFAEAFGNADDPDAHAEQVRALYQAIHSGRFDGANGRHLFFVLGLAPNAARLSVRFWHAAPLAEVARRIRDWFDDLDIDRAPFEPRYPSLKRLLSATCLATRDRPFGDIERLPPALAGDVVRAILSGGELPPLLLANTLQRCRAEQARKDDKTGKPVRHVTAARAALLRAGINRRIRIHEHQRKEITVSLDKTNTDPPYLLGRLFAVYERVQEAAAERELNRSIRDSYFGSAMATPRSVFPRLARLNQIHLRDVKRGNAAAAAYFDRLLREINDKLDAATAHAAAAGLREQGLFTLGYYHQRQSCFARGETAAPESAPGAATATAAAVDPDVTADTLTNPATNA